MTAILDAPSVSPVVMTTADGETREAKMWGQDSYSCTFCDSPVFGPADWQAHEQANADYYAKRGESYDWEPYSYRAKYWESRECDNPGCVTALRGDRLAQYRARELERKQREEQREREEAEEQAKQDREQERANRAKQLHADVPMYGRQLGFAWCCTHTEKPESYGADPVMCEASGWDRAEYDAHMRGHGKKAPGSTKLIRLRRKAPVASLPRLEIDALADVAWEQSLTVHDEYGKPDHTETAARRGQFWALGEYPHSVWVLPYEPAPWETGSPAPVLVYAGSPGTFFTDSYSAKYSRH